MGIRQVGAGNGLTWFTRALDLGGRNPRALFGGSLLGLVAFSLALMLLAMLAVFLSMAGVAADGDVQAAATRAFFAAFVPILAFALVAGPWLVAGITQLIHEVEQGQPVGALRVFAGLGGGRALALAGLALIPVAALAATLANYRLFGGPTYLQEYLAMFSQLQAGAVPVPPAAAHPVLMFFAGLAISALQYVLQMLTVPLVQLGRLGTLPAIGQALAALRLNPGAIVVMLLLGVAAMLGLSLALLLLFVILGVLAALAPALAVVIGLPLLLLVSTVVLVVFTGVGYQAWRDLFGDGGGVPAVPSAGLEV